MGSRPIRLRIVDPALVPALRPALPALGIGVLCAAASGIALLGALWCVVQLLGQSAPRWALWACSMWVAGAALSSLSSWLAHGAEARFEARLRRQVAARLVRLPASTLARYSGDGLRRLVSDDIAALHHMVAHLPAEIATLVVVPAATVVLLVGAAGPVALLALIPGLLAALCYLLVIPRLAARHGVERADVMSEIVSAVDDYARGIRICRIHGAQAGAAASYAEATARFTRGMVERVSRVATAAAIAVALLQAVSTFAIAYAVGYQWDAETLAATLLFSLAIVTPALRLGHGLDYVAAGRAAAVRLAAVLRETAIARGEGGAPASGATLLDVENLRVMLGTRCVLDRLTHSFQPGTVTAITGPSGAGKSTLLRALAGLEPPSAGTIRLGHSDIEDIGEDARHLSVLLIPQGGDALPAPVRDNLALVAGDASDEEYAAALRRAQIDVALDANGALLSGGERQRVGLARAFLTPAPVILLDEPSSALDDQTASLLMDELHRLAHWQAKTLVIVTHDPGLAAKADAQLALEDAAATGEER